MNKLNFLSGILFIFSLSIILSFVINEYIPNWVVPAEYEMMTNQNDDERAGKSLYVLHCKSCHGKYGEGDGPKAVNLNTDSGDFTLDEFQFQSDGALFYKTKIGRSEMPEFSKKLDDDEIWSIVSYMRTL